MKKTLPGPSGKDLSAYLSGFTKKFGSESAFVLDGSSIEGIEKISSGVPPLDDALGGGVPKKRIIEIYGLESSGKTTLSILIGAQAQKQGGFVHFIDAEHALDPVYAQTLGLDMTRTLISQPDQGEQGLEEALFAAESGADLIIVDSVAALVPRAEVEGEIGDQHMGLQARMMSQALRKLTPVFDRSGSTLIFINQIRHKIGVVYGNPETTPGGNALKFYASVRMEVRKGTPMKNDEGVYGHMMKVKVVKNKVAPPFREAEFPLIYGVGVDAVRCWLDKAVDMKIVEQAGVWYSYNGTRMGQGAENAKMFLVQNPTILTQIKEAIANARS